MANPFDCFLWELIFYSYVCYIVVKEVMSFLGLRQLMIVAVHEILCSLIIHEGVLNDFLITTSSFRH